MNLFKQYTPKDGYVPLVKPGKDGIEFLEEGSCGCPPAASIGAPARAVKW